MESNKIHWIKKQQNLHHQTRHNIYRLNKINEPRDRVQKKKIVPLLYKTRLKSFIRYINANMQSNQIAQYILLIRRKKKQTIYSIRHEP